MIVINEWHLDDTPSEPFERGGTSRGIFHGRLARLVGDGTRDPTWAVAVEKWHRVAQFDTFGPPGCFDLCDVDRTNERQALRSDGDVACVSEHQQDRLDTDDSLWDLLTAIPMDTDLHELDAARFESTFASGSAVRRLIGRFSGHGIDPTTAVVLLARVRPRLVPVDDRLVSTTLGLRIDEDPLRFWWWALHHDTELVAGLRRLRAMSEHLAERSLLRVAEALVFCSATPFATGAGRR